MNKYDITYQLLVLCTIQCKSYAAISQMHGIVMITHLYHKYIESGDGRNEPGGIKKELT